MIWNTIIYTFIWKQEITTNKSDKRNGEVVEQLFFPVNLVVDLSSNTKTWSSLWIIPEKNTEKVPHSSSIL